MAHYCTNNTIYCIQTVFNMTWPFLLELAIAVSMHAVSQKVVHIYPGFILVIPSEVMEGMLGHASILYCMLITYKVDNHQTNPFLTELVTKLY